jgi:hypothetical protein
MISYLRCDVNITTEHPRQQKSHRCAPADYKDILKMEGARARLSNAYSRPRPRAAREARAPVGGGGSAQGRRGQRAARAARVARGQHGRPWRAALIRVKS